LYDAKQGETCITARLARLYWKQLPLLLTQVIARARRVEHVDDFPKNLSFCGQKGKNRHPPGVGVRWDGLLTSVRDPKAISFSPKLRHAGHL